MCCEQNALGQIPKPGDIIQCSVRDCEYPCSHFKSHTSHSHDGACGRHPEAVCIPVPDLKRYEFPTIIYSGVSGKNTHVYKYEVDGSTLTVEEPQPADTGRHAYLLELAGKFPADILVEALDKMGLVSKVVPCEFINDCYPGGVKFEQELSEGEYLVTLPKVAKP